MINLNCGKVSNPFRLLLPAMVTIFSLGLFAPKPAHADTITGTGWKGTSGANWSNTGNWDSAAPNTSGSGDRNLFFGQGYKAAGGSSSSPNNDLTDWHGYRLTFQDSNSGGTGTDGSSANDTAFTITGNFFGLFDFGGVQPRIENDSFLTQTFTLTSGQTISLSGGGGGNKAEVNPVNGDLMFSAGTKLDLVGITQLQIFGNNGKNVTFSDVISSSGNSGANSVAINQNSTVVFGAANTYTGDTFINAGTLRFNSGASVASAFIRLGDTIASSPAANLLLGSGASISTPINVRNGTTPGTRTIANTGSGTGETLSGSIYLDAALTINSPTAGDTLTISGTEFDLKAQTLTIGTCAGGISISSVIKNTTGTGSILKNNNTGALTLSGANTYSGTTTIQRGTLNVSSINSVTTPTPAANSSLGVPSSSANGTITLGTGAQAAVLNYTGTGETSDRIIASANSTGTSRVDASGTGLLKLTSPLSVTAAGNRFFGFGGTGTGEFAGTIGNPATSGTTAITKTAAGTWTVSGNNTFSGGVTLDGGLLNVSHVNGLSSVSNLMTMTGNLSLDNLTGGALSLTHALACSGGSLTYVGSANDLSLSGAVSISGAASRTFTISGNKLTLSGVVTDGQGGGTGGGTNLTKAGNGTLVLSNTGNNYGGKTTVSAGTLSITKLNNASSASSVGTNGTIALGATTVGGTLLYTGSGDTSDRVIDLASTTGGDTIQADGTGTLTLNSALTATGAGAKTLTLQGSNVGANTLGGAVVNSSSATSLAKSGTGKWVLSGVSTYTGTTTVNDGTLQLSGGTDRLPTGTALSIGNSATAIFDLNGNNQTVGSLAGVGPSGSVTLGSGTLTVGGTTTTSYAGTLSGTGGILVKQGSGTLTLTNDNTHTGGTTLTAGTLNVNTPTAIGTGPLIINGGSYGNTSTLSISNNNNNPVTINGDFTMPSAYNVILGKGNITLGTAAGTSRTITTTGVGTLQLDGVIANGTTANQLIINVNNTSGQFNLYGTNTFTGGLVLQKGFLALGKTATTAGGQIYSAGTGAITLGDPAGGDAVIGVGSYTLTNAINLASGAVGNLSFGASGATRTPIFTGPVALNGNNLTIDTRASSGNVRSSGSITGIGNLTLNNAKSSADSQLYVTNINNTGSITVSSGTNVNTSYIDTVGANVSGLTLNAGGGGGTPNNNVFLSGINAYGGTTTLGSRSTLNVSSAANLGNTTNIVINQNATLVMTNNSTAAIASAIDFEAGSPGITVSGTGTLTVNGQVYGTSTTPGKDGGGTLTLNASNYFSSTALFLMSGGGISLGHPAALNNAILKYNGGNKLDNTTGGPLTPVGMRGLDMTAGFTFVGSDNLDLSGMLVGFVQTANSARTLTVSAKTLTIAGINSTTTNANGTARVDGSLIKSGAGTLAIASGGGYTLGTTVSAGSLLVNNPTGSGTGTGAVTVNGGTLGGSGTIAGAVTVNTSGNIQAGLGGTNTSALTLGSTLMLTAGSTNLVVINRTNSPNSGKLIVASTFTLGGTLAVTNVGPAPQAGDTFTLYTVGVTPTGNFAATNLPALDASLNWWQIVTNTSDIALLVNTKPTVSDISMGAQTGVLQTLPLIGADKHAPYDADSNPMTISVVTQGTNNGVVVISGNNVTYSNNVAGLDSFTYTVSDNHGGSATGTVLVNVTDVVNQQATISYTGGTVSLTFWGVPGTSYTIQRATDVNGPWTDLTPDVTASSTQPYGQIPLSDTPPANGSYFYRLKP